MFTVNELNTYRRSSLTLPVGVCDSNSSNVLYSGTHVSAQCRYKYVAKVPVHSEGREKRKSVKLPWTRINAMADLPILPAIDASCVYIVNESGGMHGIFVVSIIIMFECAVYVVSIMCNVGKFRDSF